MKKPRAVALAQITARRTLRRCLTHKYASGTAAMGIIEILQAIRRPKQRDDRSRYFVVSRSSARYAQAVKTTTKASGRA
jgi:hypothetical protein